MQPAHASTRAVINFTNSTDPVTEGPLAVFTTTANGVEEMFIMWDATKIAFSYSPSTGRDNIYSTLVCSTVGDSMVTVGQECLGL